jgi:hypothetical protein
VVIVPDASMVGQTCQTDYHGQLTFSQLQPCLHHSCRVATFGDPYMVVAEAFPKFVTVMRLLDSCESVRDSLAITGDVRSTATICNNAGRR